MFLSCFALTAKDQQVSAFLPSPIHSSALTGCDGRNIPEEVSRWELMVDQFTNYFTDLNLKAGEVVKDIRSSQISRELE